MTKELDTFSYAFMVELVDCPKRNAFPCRKGNPEMFRFPGGYYSFDEEGKMDGCHLYVQDYQSNNRMVVNTYTDEVEQINHYYPYGALMADISTNPNEQPYKYGEKELDRQFGLDLYDFEARQQDPLVGRFTSIDPLAEDAPQASPYAYCEGDPINFIDPTGMHPIYDPNGNFLGTDDEGLQGDYFIMDLADFYQGMSPSEAQACAKNQTTLTQMARMKINTHYRSLPYRPDYDGFVTVSEGIRWAKEHPFALQFPTPDNTLYINTALLDFGGVGVYYLLQHKGQVNLFETKDWLGWYNAIHGVCFDLKLLHTVYALGLCHMELIDEEKRLVRIVNDEATDYDWNLGGSSTRNTCIIVNNWLRNIDPDIHGFKTWYYGVGKLNH